MHRHWGGEPQRNYFCQGNGSRCHGKKCSWASLSSAVLLHVQLNLLLSALLLSCQLEGLSWFSQLIIKAQAPPLSCTGPTPPFPSARGGLTYHDHDRPPPTSPSTTTIFQHSLRLARLTSCGLTGSTRT